MLKKFEGKNIHFSPLDNKPLCSYSSKLCRQRRLNGYAFCIRHILEDKSAPFKQCGFVTRNNSQKCLNAIPSNQERGFCHSHMQKVVTTPDTTQTTTAIFPINGNGKSLNNDNNNKSSFLLSSSSSPLIKNCLNFHSSLVRDVLQNKETISNGDSFTTQEKISNNLHKGYESASLSSSTSSLSSIISNNNNNNNNHIVSSSNTTSSTSTTTTIFATFPASTTTTSTVVKNNNGTNPQTTTFQQKGKSSFNISSSNIINNSGFKVICEKPVNNSISSITNNKTINNVNKSVNLQNFSSNIAPIKSKIESSETSERYNLNNNNIINNSTKKVRNNIIVTSYPDNNNKQQLIIGNQPNLKKKPQFYNKPTSVNNTIIINHNNNNTNTNKNIQFGTDNNNKLTNTTINSTNNISSQQSNNNNNNSSSTITSSPAVATLLCVRDRWKKFKFNPKIGGGDEDIKPAIQLEHMKTIKILEKLPLFAESGNKTDDKCHVKLEHTGNKLGKRSSFSTLPISSGIEILLVPPFLSKSKLHSNNNNSNNNNKNKITKPEIKQEHTFTTTTNGIDKGQTEIGIESSSNDPIQNYFKNYTKIKIEDGNCENDKKISQSKEDNLQPWEWETRKEFLARVRRAFKRQYKTITKASKLSEKQDKSDKAFREALVTCALNDSSKCAQILVSDPKFEETATMTGKRGGGGGESGVQVEIKKENEIQFGNNISMNNIKNNNYVNSTIGTTAMTTTTTTYNSGKSSFLQNPNDKSRMKKLFNGKISPADGKINSVRLNNGFDNDSICDLQIVNTKSGINNNNKLNNLANGNYLWPNGCNSNSSSSSSSAENLPDPDCSKKIKANKKLSKGNRDLNGNNQFSVKSYANPNQTLNGINNSSSFVKTSKNTLNGNNVPSPKKKAKKATTSPTSLKSSFKKRKVDSDNSELVSHLDFNNQQSINNGQQQLDSMVLESSHHHDDNLLRNSLNSHEQLLSVPSSSSSSSVDHLQSVSNLETVLGSVSSSEAATTDASFDSPFDHSTSSQPDLGDFSDDDDLENSFELQLDPEITHQASRLLEDNGLTEDDFNDLFPETRMGDHKLNGDLGIDFSSNFDTTDIHYDSLFANIFPSFRTNLGQPESISVNNQF